MDMDPIKAMRVMQSVWVVAAIIYSYNSIQPVIKPLTAPHVWLIEQGLEMVKK